MDGEGRQQEGSAQSTWLLGGLACALNKGNAAVLRSIKKEESWCWPMQQQQGAAAPPPMGSSRQRP